MDFKGITWAGNIYQKFEAMCLEVEEAMYQDTVKYMENQVQKVGVTVKKFCSEVIEDLRPPCVDPVNSDTDVIKKSTPSVFKSQPTKENEDKKISNVTPEKGFALSGYYNINSLSPQNKTLDSRALTRKRLGVHRRPVGIKRIPKNNHPSKDSCRLMSSSDDISVMSSAELDGGTSVGSTACDKILSAESVKDEDDLGGVSPASGEKLLAESVSGKKNDLDSFAPAFENDLLAESERLKGDPESTSSCSGLPTESTDPVNIDTDVVKKSTPNVLESQPTKENEDQTISNVTSEKESSLSECYDINSLSPQNKSSDAVPRKRLGVHRRAVGIKRIPNNNHPSKDSCRVVPSGDDISVMSSADPGGTSVGSTACDKILSAESVKDEDDSGCVSPASGENLSAESVREKKNDLDFFTPAFENDISAESERLKGELKSTSSCYGLPMESTGTSKNDDISFSSSVRSEASNLVPEEEEVMVSNEGTSRSSSGGTTSCKAESWEKAIIVCNEDSFGIEVIENEEFYEQRRKKILKPVETEKLEESCIFVESDHLHCIPHDSRKHKSYKKKIREALSSKLKLKEDLGGKIKGETVILTHAMDSEEKKSTAYDSLESDWELL